MNGKTLKILLTLAVVAGGAVFLVFSSVGHAQYYKMVDELMVAPAEWEGKDLKVHGWVVAGSIEEKIVAQKMQRTFVLENKGQRITITHEGPKPDTFRDMSEVVAQGRLLKQGDAYVLQATELMAKCPSKYEGAAQNKHIGDSKPVFE